MITIYHEKTKDFSHNGYGAIDTDIITPSVHWRLNSFFNLEFDYKSESRNYEHLKNKNILKVPVPFMDPQLFRIYRTADILGGVRVFARHIFYDLLDNLVEDTFIVEKNGQGALVQMFGATQYSHDFKGFSDVTVRNNARIVRRNPVEALLDDGLSNSIISRWGGEVLLDNFNIHLRKRLGANRGVKIEHKKDLLGYESTIDESTVATRIYPRGFDGLELPERYVDSPKLDPDNPKIKIVRYEDVKAAIGEYADDEDAVPLEEAIEELRRLAKEEFEIHHIDEPETTILIDFVSLHNTKEYKHFSHLQAIHPGDTVSVSVPDQKFEVTSRMVEFKSDPRYEDEYLSVTLGNHVSEFTSSSVSPSRMRENISQATDIALRAYQSANTKNTTYLGEANPNDIEGLKPNVDDRYIQENGEVKRFWIFVERNGQKYWHEAMNNVENSKTKKAIEDTLDEFEELRDNVDTLEGLITIIDGLPYIAGENIYLDGDTNVDGTFTITKEMIAPEVITDHLSATGINANDIDVFNLTADNFLANRLDIAGGFRIMNGHEEVLTVDSTTGKTIFNAPNVATKEDLKTIELTPGPPGPQGERGKDGEQGPKGEDGISIQSTNVQYYQSTDFSNLRGGSWRNTPPVWEDGKYLFTRTVTTYSNGQVSTTEPINVTGSSGQYGRSVSNITEQYYLSTSKDRPTGGGWITSHPLWQPETYVFTRLKIDYTNPTGTEYTAPVVDSSWEAMENIKTEVDLKADQESLDEVSTQLSDFQTISATKDEIGEITSALYAYVDDLYQNERNLETAREDIDRLLTRLPIIENNLGAWVERWSFLDTYVTLGNEGLMISEMNGSTGIRVSKDRIDFLDGSGEPVAYITNQVMRINRGIFVDSMQVGEHKVETIAGGHTIWQWMG